MAPKIQHTFNWDAYATLISQGLSQRQIAKQWGCSQSHLSRAYAEHQRGSTTPGPGLNLAGGLPAVIEAEDLGPLTAEEEHLLARHEAVIERGLQRFVEVGMALADIREKKLYRAQSHTFEAYLSQRWHLGRAQGYRLMDAAEVMRDLSPIGDMGPLPANEAQARELAAVPADERQAVWETAVKTAPKGKITATHIKAVVGQKQDTPVKKTLEVKPVHPRVVPQKPRRQVIQELLIEALSLVPDAVAMTPLRGLHREIGAAAGDLQVGPAVKEQVQKLLDQAWEAIDIE